MSLTLTIENLCKSYDGVEVLNGFGSVMSAPQIYCLMAPSGAGKTTLLRLIMGLEKQDSGSIVFTEGNTAGHVSFSAVFQEDRLINHLTPIENIALVMPGRGDPEAVRRELLQLLPEEACNRPVSTLSGGMKRRCAFLRAVMADSDAVIMDEPFTGLDAATKGNVIQYLLAHQNGRLLIISTHDPEDVRTLGAQVVELA